LKLYKQAIEYHASVPSRRDILFDKKNKQFVLRGLQTTESSEKVYFFDVPINTGEGKDFVTDKIYHQGYYLYAKVGLRKTDKVLASFLNLDLEATGLTNNFFLQVKCSFYAKSRKSGQYERIGMEFQRNYTKDQSGWGIIYIDLSSKWKSDEPGQLLRPSCDYVINGYLQLQVTFSIQ
jgi:hypothetical protein